jgi:hypothetical protein
MLSLLYHCYRMGPAFMRANAAALAIIHIRLEKTILGLLHAAFRTIYITDTAFNAFLIVPNWPLRPPTSRVIFTGAARLGNNTTYGKLSPCF